jgi:hypothetical protein
MRAIIRRRPGESRRDVRGRLGAMVSDWFARPCGFSPEEAAAMADRLTAEAMAGGPDA